MPTSLTRETLSVHAPSRSASISTGPSCSASISVSRSASAAASRSVSAARPGMEDGDLSNDDRILLASALSVPLHLTEPTNRHKGDLQHSYKVWGIIQEAEATRKRILHTLPKKFTFNDVISLFMSRSAYYKNPDKVFPKLVHHPEMEKWLRNEEDAPSKASVWGATKPTFDNLREILNIHAERSQPGSSKKSSSHKGKKRKAEDEEKEKKKKSKLKDKRKTRSKDE